MVINCFLFNSYAGAQNCNPPINIQTVVKGKDFIDLRWTHNLQNLDHFQIKLIHKTSEPDTIIYESNLNVFTINNLEPSQQYEVEIRSFCTVGMTSPAKYQFTTVIDNDNACDIHLDILERNPCTPQIFDIEVKDIPGNQLGIDIDFSDIELIISHGFPADLSISLISPSGKSVLLSSRNGITRNNYGDPSVENCMLPIVFTPLACDSITNLSGPFVGAVLPEESTIIFQDSTNPNGIWKLLICDDFVDMDPGFLQYVKINFSNDACTPSPAVHFTAINAEFASVSVANFSQCDSVILEIVPEGKSPGFGLTKGDPENILIHMPCAEDTYLISGLLADTEYTLYTRTHCTENRFSFNDCGQLFRTLCATAPIQTGFDELILCEDDCRESCALDTIWNNVSNDGLKWIVHSGSTDTELTGPSTAVFGSGKYIYIEASDPDCLAGGPAEILSPCLHWPDSVISCDLDFHYHMDGPESGILALLVSDNGGFSWDTIWQVSGSQGNLWRRTTLSLAEYAGKNIRLKFSGMPAGALGDIALDEISLLGSVQLVQSEQEYFVDADDDGYGDPNNKIIICSLNAPEGYVGNGNDCNDQNPEIHPNQEEIPCNGLDDDCNGLIDDTEDGLRIVRVDIADATCNGLADGTINIVIAGGLPPYLIEWAHGASDAAIQDLPSGFYAATVSDQNECTSVLSNLYVGNAQSHLITVSNIIPASCSGIADAQLAIEVQTSTSGHSFEFLWNNGDTTQNLINITNGSYQVTVTDERGCVSVSSVFEVGALGNLQLSLDEVKNISCPGNNDGSIRLRAIGGVFPYEYTWQHTSENQNTLTNLVPGIYEVTISDQMGCNTTRSFTLTEPDSIKVRIKTLDPVICPGALNGKIIIEVEGGNAPYSYFWKNETANLSYFTKNILQAKAGLYFLTITDTTSCRLKVDSILVDSPDSFQINNLEIISNRCLSSKQGKIQFDLSGGTPDYTYLWSNGSNLSGLDSLNSGTYSVTINDQYNCKFLAGPFQIQTENRALELSIQDKEDNPCFGDFNGSISVEALDGKIPYEFHWSNGRQISKDFNSDTISNLAKGAYRVTITDSEGCLGIYQNLVVNGPPNPLTYNIESHENLSCHNFNDGAIKLVALGGTAPYTYIWSDQVMGNIRDNLSPGVYQCSISDAHACIVEIVPINIVEPDSLFYGLSYDGRLCSQQGGFANLSVYGGVPPYDISWQHNSFTGNGTSISNAPCGQYQIEIMDNAGCMLNFDFVMDETTALKDEELSLSWKLYPNPAQNRLYLESLRSLGQAFDIQLFNAQGILIKTFQNQGSNPSVLDIESLAPGYFRILWYIENKWNSLPFIKIGK